MLPHSLISKRRAPCNHVVVFAFHSAWLRHYLDVWMLQVHLSRQIILSTPAASVAWMHLLLPASLGMLFLCGAHSFEKKVCRDNDCNLEGLLFVSLSKPACWGGTNCRTRLQLRGPHKQSCLFLKLNSLILDLGTAGTGEKRERIWQLFQWGWQSGLRV